MFCPKCGHETPDYSPFCTYCGSKMAGGGTMAGASVNDYSSKIEWRPPEKPVRKSISGCGWVLIGCGGLFVLSLIGFFVIMWFGWNSLIDKFDGMENMPVASELSTIQLGLQEYKISKGTYGDFKELKSAGVFNDLDYLTLTQFKIETANGTYELVLPPDKIHFKLKGTAKVSGKTWDLDETSDMLLTDLLGIDTKDLMSQPSSGG